MYSVLSFVNRLGSQPQSALLGSFFVWVYSSLQVLAQAAIGASNQPSCCSPKGLHHQALCSHCIHTDTHIQYLSISRSFLSAHVYGCTQHTAESVHSLCWHRQTHTQHMLYNLLQWLAPTLLSLACKKSGMHTHIWAHMLGETGICSLFI